MHVCICMMAHPERSSMHARMHMYDGPPREEQHARRSRHGPAPKREVGVVGGEAGDLRDDAML